MKSTSMDAASTSRPSSSSSHPFSSSKAEVSLATIMDQLQLMRADFGSRLDHLSDKMCKMNTRIGRISRRQSHLGGFAHSPSLNLVESFSDGGDDDDDASSFEIDDEMTPS